MATDLLPDRGRILAMRAPLGVASLAVTAVGVVALVDPNEPGHYPTCPFLALTGLFCPGCGSLRAVHALAQGDLATAVGLNLLTTLAVLPMVVVWLMWARRSWIGAHRHTAVPVSLVRTLLVVAVVFAVLRNLPFGAALAP